MPKNTVVLHINGSPWTLGAVCLVVAGLMFLVWIVLMPMVAQRFGEVRRLTSDEAATLALAGHQTSYVKPEAVVHAPAAGKEWHFSITIGDLRDAWQQQQYRIFVGLPAYYMFGTGAFALFGVGFAILVAMPAPLAFTACALLCDAVMLFMMWAAVYTKLE